jgi:2-iminoacetate synthase
MKRQLTSTYKRFIDPDALTSLLSLKEDKEAIASIVQKSLEKVPLQPEETAILLSATSQENRQMIYEAARKLKREVYGNRIVLFAPLYIGSECINDCSYCSFRRSNPSAFRRTLTPEEIQQQVLALEQQGHKRLILVFGEHPSYDPHWIAQTVASVYATKRAPGEIRRVNINAAPLSQEGFKIVHDAGIGTYQIFQETYHPEAYARVHPAQTMKGDYDWRLDSLSRAFEGGCDDMGLGVLFGLHDWRFEVLSLVKHSVFLQGRYGVGPHTISFPRLQPAHGIPLETDHLVSDEEFKMLVAVLRLSVPYTGMILTARESEAIRREILGFGVSQIDAGSRIEIGGYTECGDAQVMEREQFQLADMRSMEEIMRQLLQDGYLPSFCTSCYRKGRTGEHFMEFAIPGFIERFCTPNGLLTLMEYLEDYAKEETKALGMKVIERELGLIENVATRNTIRERLSSIRSGALRDTYF